MLPHLSSSRLELVETTAADLEELVDLWNHPEVRRFLFDDEPVARDHAAELIGTMQSRQTEGLGSWTVRLHGGSALIGQAGLMPTTSSAIYEPKLSGLVEPVVAIHPDFQRQGLPREALTLPLTHAFETLGLDRLAAAVDAPNTASCRLIEGLGFTLLNEVPGPDYVLRTYVITATAMAQSVRDRPNDALHRSGAMRRQPPKRLRWQAVR